MGHGGRGRREPRASDQRFRALVHHSHDLVSIYDASGRFVYASPSHQRVIGYDTAELVGTSPLDYLHPDERDAVLQAFSEQITGAAPPAPVEHRMRCKDGSWRYLEAVAVDLTDDPAVGGVLVNTRDVTDRRRAELLAADQTRILEQIARNAPLRETLDAVIAMMERWMPGGLGAIGVVDESDESFRLIAAPSYPPACRAAIETYPVSAEAAPAYPQRVFAAVSVTTCADPRRTTSCARDGFETFWVGRMKHPDGETRLGGVIVLRPDSHPPTDADVRLLDLAAAVAAIAIERDPRPVAPLTPGESRQSHRPPEPRHAARPDPQRRPQTAPRRTAHRTPLPRHRPLQGPERQRGPRRR